MIDICALCGLAGPVDRHHVTRRPRPGAAYFDPSFTVPLCRSCHAGVHQVLRVAVLDWPSSAADPLAYRLRTVAGQVELFGAHGSTFPVSPTAAPALAALLREAAWAIDAASSAREGVA
ncbi:MAG: HNH endonuclease [Actinomycetota bacterium]|jgi:hypothetical protein|nr:HNH endonuclease [Actinomycetota bacterium]MDA8358963.1 HNH endonuclease [Actinomycetota bacterium]